MAARVGAVGLGVLLLFALSYAILNVTRTDDTRFFVAAHKERRTQFVEIVTAALRESGLDPSLSHATDDRGNTHTVLRARGGNFSFWMASVTLSGEDPSPPCELRSEAYPDPEQYEVRLRSRVPFLPNQRLPQVLSKLHDLFKQHQIPFQQGPWPCGAAAFTVHQ
jgi:hypothetical protein